MSITDEKLIAKRVLVTGASGGLGKALVQTFGQAGCHMGLHYHRNGNEIKKLEDELREQGIPFVTMRADLSKPSEACRVVPQFIEKWGGIDILINNAGGVIGEKEFQEISPTDWSSTYQLNAGAPFFLCQKAFPLMKKQKSGKIISISSIAAKYGGYEKTIHYAGAKAALENMTLGLARMGASHNILVNAIRSGLIATPVWKKMKKNIKKRIGMTPLQRMAKPDEIAQLALFLASSYGDYITGEIYSIDGGD